jgi:hypothetical protein
MKRLLIALMVLIMMGVTVTPATSQNWEFNWTLLDTAAVPDLAGYRVYLVERGQPIVISQGGHLWQSADTNPSLPLILNVPEGSWDSVLTSFDLSGKESPPTIICQVTVDTVPPTPNGYSCQAAP